MIAIGSDHGGFKLKEELKKYYGNKLMDFGAYNDIRGLDEPKIAIAVAEEVKNGECEAGILICRSGIGMSIAANKVEGIRCAVCYNKEIAISAKEHNNANILAFGADFVTINEAIERIDAWQNAKFLDGIYQERLYVVDKYEEKRK